MKYLKNVVTLRLDQDACVGCELCTKVCPHGVFGMADGKARLVDRDACIECGACARNCPVSAITVQAGVGCAAGIMASALGLKTDCCSSTQGCGCSPTPRDNAEPAKETAAACAPACGCHCTGTTSGRTRGVLGAIIAVAAAAVVLTGLAMWVPARAADSATAPVSPPPFVLLFASPDCEDCLAIKEWWGQHPEQTGATRLVVLDAEQPANFGLLIQLEKLLAVQQTNAAFPALYGPGSVVYGREAILAALPDLLLPGKQKAPVPALLAPVVAALAGGKPAIVEFNMPAEAPPAAALTPATPQPEARKYLAFFHLPGCRKCSRQDVVLRQLEKTMPDLVLRRFDITTPEGRAAFDAVRAAFNLRDDAKSYIPMLVWDGGCSQDANLAPDEVRARLQVSAAAPAWMEIKGADLASAETRARALFERMTLFLIIGGGLLDGINPCAFATAVFLVGYLVYLKRGRRDIIILGGSFCAGVFLTYFLIGLGLSQVVDWLTRFPWVKALVYGVLGVGGVVLGLLHARDAVRYRRHGVKGMQMGLSKGATLKIHEYVRRYANSKMLVLSGLVLGFLISSLELACTGQIYLPILVLINRLGTTGRSLLALVVYNLAFIVPLILVTIIAASGVSSKALVTKAQQSIFGTKVAMSVLFFAIGGVMLWLALRP